MNCDAGTGRHSEEVVGHSGLVDSFAAFAAAVASHFDAEFALELGLEPELELEPELGLEQELSLGFGFDLVFAGVLRIVGTVAWSFVVVAVAAAAFEVACAAFELLVVVGFAGESAVDASVDFAFASAYYAAASSDAEAFSLGHFHIACYRPLRLDLEPHYHPYS